MTLRKKGAETETLCLIEEGNISIKAPVILKKDALCNVFIRKFIDIV